VFRTVRVGGGIAVAVVALLAATLPAAADPTTTKAPATSGPSVSGEPGTSAGPLDEDIHADPAMLAASDALVAAENDLAAARVALAAIRDELAAAQQVEHQARVDLRAAELAEERADRSLATVRERIAGHRTDLGRLASAAYKGNGPLGSWSLILASQTPEQLVDRLGYVQSVSNAGNSMIADLQEERANLTTLQARLAAARMLQERERAAAAAAVKRMVEKEKQATLAEEQLHATVLVHRAALDAALLAKADDQARYQALVTQSGQLGERIRSMAARLAALPRPPKGTGSFVRPGTGALTSPYGPRLHPILRYVKVHTGMDLGSGDGIVYAADRGVVLLTEFNTAYGNMTVIDHGTVGGLHLTTLYAHQAAFAVRPGARVRKGQPIGVVGSTGFATGPHLHFEVRIDGAPLDPAPFLKGAPMPVTLARRAAGA
jgi:murein DD-endopeptidase MepM/ murein hydrolase activator NlpD